MKKNFMKFNFRLLLVLCLTLYGYTTVQAQYNRYGSQYYGRPNSIIPSANDKPDAPVPQTAEEIVANEMPQIAEAAELNEFEQAIVSSILTKYVKQSLELRLLELEPREAKENMDKIREKQRNELKAGLPEDKYNTLIEIQEKGVKKVQNEKKKKKKKKQKSSS